MLRELAIAKVVRRNTWFGFGFGRLTWIAPSFQNLFDTHLPDWRQEQFSQRYAVGISTSDIWAAHVEAKRW